MDLFKSIKLNDFKTKDGYGVSYKIDVNQEKAVNHFIQSQIAEKKNDWAAEINRKINIPLIGEATEQKAIDALFDVVNLGVNHGLKFGTNFKVADLTSDVIIDMIFSEDNKGYIVKKLNENINLPWFTEKTEEWIFNGLFDIIKRGLKAVL